MIRLEVHALCSHDKSRTAVGPLCKALNPALLQGLSPAQSNQLYDNSNSYKITVKKHDSVSLAD